MSREGSHPSKRPAELRRSAAWTNNVKTELESLQLDLDSLQHLFVLAGEDQWNRLLQPISEGSRSSTDLSRAMEELRRYFGGMGSLNDLVFCAQNNNIPKGYTEEAANRELGQLLDQIYRCLSLYGAPAAIRENWRREESESDLPLRIRDSFRRRS